MVGSCATFVCEPGQVRNEAAFSGNGRVPQIAWPSPHLAPPGSLAIGGARGGAGILGGMAYQSLYRRYRPRRFADMRGQEHVVLALRNAVRDDRLGHAHLFSGPRGTGKTTSARILAKVLNCTNVQDGEPCCECASCKAVEAGTSYDVHELDAASNNGVDSMRDLIEKTMLGTPGRFKVYILDEVHMLSKAAEAALLKTLEEPPPHVIFVLATTDPQKVSETIRSRCQKLQFNLISADVLADHVRWIIKDAGLTVGDDAIEIVVRQGGGSARDTLSALEQVVAAGGVAPDAEPLDELIEALIDSDSGRAIVAVATAVRDGRDARTLTESLVAHLRDCFLSLMSPELVQLPDRSAQRVLDQGKRLGVASTVRAMEVLGEMLVELRHAPDPRLLLDVAIVRLTNVASDTSPAALLARLERLEQAVSSGGTITAAAPSTSAAQETANRPPGNAPGSTQAKIDRLAGNTPAAGSTQARIERLAGNAPVAPDSDVEDDGAAVGAAQEADRAANATSAAADVAPTISATPPPAAERARLGTRVNRPAATSTPVAATPPTPSAAATAAARLAGEAATTEAPPTSTVATGPLPGRDELTLQWADQILPKLKGLPKAIYAPGRFIDSEHGSAVYALPSTTPLAKGEQYRAEVEAALARHFGRPVPLKLIADKPEVDRSRPAPSEATPYEEEVYDPAELVDAPPENARTGMDKLVEAFPGAELLDEQN
jgi:DNA polymerase III subunit gamma/tau